VIAAVVCGLVGMVGGYFVIEDHSGGMLARLGYMAPSSLFSSIHDAAAGLASLMPRLSSGDAVLVSASGLTALVIFKVVKNINLLYLAVTVAGYKQGWIKLSKEGYIVLVFFVISTLPLFVLAGNQLFMSSRYTVLSITIFTLIVCQYITYLFYKLKNEKSHVAAAGLVVLVVLFFLDAIIHTGAIKGNMVSASEWVSQHVEPKARIACNNKRFSFYTKKQCTYEKPVDENLIAGVDEILYRGNYDYLLLWVKNDDRKIRDYLDTRGFFELLRTFKNKRNDEARVYRIRYR
jgi:hypothetical protein